MSTRTPIRALDDLTISRIAAGEVVERPASVVKELVENSLDAGATEVRVEIAEGGRRLIRVVDNGRGIPADQVLLAFQRHATSKLQSSADLELIASLGFRGEALAAIASVAIVTLVTRAEGEEAGTRLRIDNGVVMSQQPTGSAVGTNLLVENLFNAVPARLKFMKSEPTEAGRILEVVTHYALAYPHVRFTLERDGRKVLQSPGTGDLVDALKVAFGSDAAQMIPLPQPIGPPVTTSDASPGPESQIADADQDPGSDSSTGRNAEPATRYVHVHGFVSPPHLHKATRKDLTLFVNGRAIQDSSLNYAVSQAYHTLIPKGRYPLAVIMIRLSPESVDVNVHPAKTEVRFRDGRAVFSAVERAVRAAVIGSAPIAPVRESALPTFGSPPATRSTSREWDLWREAQGVQREIRESGGPADAVDPWLRGTSPARPLDQSGNATDAARPSAPKPSVVQPSASLPRPPDPWDVAAEARHGAEAGDDEDRGQSTEPGGDSAGFTGLDLSSHSDAPSLLDHAGERLPMLRVIGQVAQAYIVAEGPDGLYLVDQHAAHERVMYENFMRRHMQGGVPVQSQHLLEPEVVPLSPLQMGVVDEHAEALARVGFEVAPFGPDAAIVRAIPEVLASAGTTPDVLRGILDQTGEGQAPVEETFEARLVRAVCKKATVKAGQALSMEEMRGLLTSLEACQSPRTCPHGRPTMLVLGAAWIGREFGR